MEYSTLKLFSELFYIQLVGAWAGECQLFMLRRNSHLHIKKRYSISIIIVLMMMLKQEQGLFTLLFIKYATQ